MQKVEEKSLQFKRSIYVSEPIKAGEVISEKNIRVIRPAFGLAPKYYDTVLGKKVKKDLNPGTPLSMDDLI